jgi:hypothetical protein
MSTLTDELALQVGDDIRPEFQYYFVYNFSYLDGWCFGTNMRTGKVGTFPVGCLAPAVLPYNLIIGSKSIGLVLCF